MMDNIPPSWKLLSKSTEASDPSRVRRAATPLALDERTVFHGFQQQCDLQDAVVLEVGGALPRALALAAGVQTWIAVDPLIRSDKNDEHYRVVSESILTASIPSESTDLIFSCNALHHISPLAKCLRVMFNCLRPGGVAYLHFGPIWSAPDGHHLDIQYRHLTYRFETMSIVPHWFHLAFSPEELRTILLTKLEAALVDTVIDYIFNSTWLNRRFFEDYLRSVEEAGFILLHLLSSTYLDYDEDFPEYEMPRGERWTTAALHTRIRERHGEDKRNLECRDLLLVLTKPR